MKSLRECIREAEEKKAAVGHFNISNIEGLWGVFGAAKELGVPVIIGTSEGEREFIGVRQAAALVASVREEFDYPIFLNADHTYTVEGVQKAAEAGYDAVIFDGAKLPYEENVAETRKAAETARATRPDIVVEAELGYIGQSSKVLDTIPEGVKLDAASLTSPEQAKAFVEATGINLLAPAVGNIHGMLSSGTDPHLDIERIRAIREAAGVPLVLHGGSGTTDDDFKQAIAAGISIVHINTEIRVGYKNALKRSLEEHPDEVAPYKIMKESVAEIKRITLARLKLFNNL